MDECVIKDNLQEEMLRIVLKRFIITCTRIARERFSISEEKEKSFDIVRQFYVLVDQHYKEKKQVQDYAELLYRSPKTISNLFAEYGLPTPLRIIHERVEAEAKRLLLYTNKSAKEISGILGFDDIAAFSRFFKKMTKESISEYRKREKQD
jgi:AraC family transcriptional activator of pobA